MSVIYMKNSIKKVILLSIFLIIISLLVINFMGKTYTMSFDIGNISDYKFFIEEENGKIEILEEKLKDGNYLIKIKAKKTGTATIYLDYGEFQTGKRIYIHKNMVITEENFFGKSTGSIIIPICPKQATRRLRQPSKPILPNICTTLNLPPCRP